MVDLKNFLKKKNDLNIFALNETDSYVKKMKSRYTIFKINPNAEHSHIKFFANYKDVVDVPIVCNSKEEMYDKMKWAINNKMSGPNFCLGMLSDNGKYEVWIRSNQPCQGGEMRKYGCTHDDCTRPNDPRPTDLSHPFPDGIPLAVGTNISLSFHRKLLFNNGSIYQRAFGDESNIKFVEKGFIVLDANLCDPTVFVNFVNHLRYDYNDNHHIFKMIKDWTFGEAKVLLDYQIYPGIKMLSKQGVSSNNKYNTSFINLEGFLKGGVHCTQDITGGPLGKRFDYNRPDLLLVFKGGKEVNPIEPLNKHFFGGTTKNSIAISYDEIVQQKASIIQALKEAA